MQEAGAADLSVLFHSLGKSALIALVDAPQALAIEAEREGIDAVAFHVGFGETEAMDDVQDFRGVGRDKLRGRTTG